MSSYARLYNRSPHSVIIARAVGKYFKDESRYLGQCKNITVQYSYDNDNGNMIRGPTAIYLFDFFSKCGIFPPQEGFIIECDKVQVDDPT